MKKVMFTLLLLFAVLIVSSGCSGNGTGTLEEQLSLGQKYLQEENYKAAIVAFEKAIEIDEKCVEAYLGLADAYVGAGDIQKATDILQRGYNKTNDGMLKKKLDEVNSQKEIATAEQKKGETETDSREGKTYQISDSELIDKVLESQEMKYIGMGETEIENLKINPTIGIDFAADGCIAVNNIPISNYYPNLQDNDYIQLSLNQFDVTGWAEVEGMGIALWYQGEISEEDSNFPKNCKIKVGDYRIYIRSNQ